MVCVKLMKWSEWLIDGCNHSQANSIGNLEVQLLKRFCVRGITVTFFLTI